MFAAVYEFVGGVDGLRAGSFFDALVFSVQTIGTIGYGVMHPASYGANVVMIVESITGDHLHRAHHRPGVREVLAHDRPHRVLDLRGDLSRTTACRP